MENIVENLIKSKNEIKETFNLSEDYFVKPLLDQKWSVREMEGIMFFKYYLDDKEHEQVVIKENGENLYRTYEDYVLIVGIDCVKISFIVRECNKIE
ncbi:MAG: hypothetical protein ACK5LV_11045 [Lachnospirales bacterium]